jgi:DNA gyrase subunit B
MFYRYFPDLINQGHIYIAQPPLYKISRGKEMHYAYSDEQKNDILKKNLQIKDAQEVEIGEVGEEEEVVATAKNKPAGVSIQRYKGLGEMNPQQLWETTMDPVTRVLLKVNIEDVARADETFSVLMGSDVAPRKKFISTHAKSVKNLDV